MKIPWAAERLEKYLKLYSRPVGIDFYKNKTELAQGSPGTKMNICQFISVARYRGVESIVSAERTVCALGAACVGLIKTPLVFSSGMAAVGRYCKNAEIGQEFFRNTFKIGDSGETFAELRIAPLDKMNTLPDVVIIYGLPVQIARLIHAYTYDTGKPVYCNGTAEAAVCSCVGFALTQKQPAMGIPCLGDRKYAGANVAEIVFVFPGPMLERIVNNLRTLGGEQVLPAPPFINRTPSMSKDYEMKSEYYTHRELN